MQLIFKTAELCAVYDRNMTLSFGFVLRFAKLRKIAHFLIAGTLGMSLQNYTEKTSICIGGA